VKIPPIYWRIRPPSRLRLMRQVTQDAIASSVLATALSRGNLS
jgi:hypothetical protein